ncbi:hypothetical protein QAD02_001261 [Eretmocerus hayati]|uniref:Uncharacterized protein n=1 Tax=Eretmocerus hayati TaxID=131215 RepID=A0ACC2NIC8_9HYME|nr:hypothetical protein QAD02_001261 [Eretmocerus hayati]
MANESIIEDKDACSSGSSSSQSEESSDEEQQFRVPKVNPKQKNDNRGKESKTKNKTISKSSGVTSGGHKSHRKRLRKPPVSNEIASDKNIATLLRSEQLAECIKNGNQIPRKLALNISRKTGFKSVDDLNDYITAHRNKFTVLVDRKERHCQNESNQCNSFRRSDSVDLQLYFSHHFGSQDENMNVTI